MERTNCSGEREIFWNANNNFNVFQTTSERIKQIYLLNDSLRKRVLPFLALLREFFINFCLFGFECRLDFSAQPFVFFDQIFQTTFSRFFLVGSNGKENLSMEGFDAVDVSPNFVDVFDDIFIESR